ncbi:MAG: hypothetical protein V3U87_16245 [Methylococcaceae bacterium]
MTTTNISSAHLFTSNSDKVENYKIFHDISINGHIDGSELLTNEWDLSQKRRWLFFYRPWFSKLAQCKQIKKLEAIRVRVQAKVKLLEQLVMATLFFGALIIFYLALFDKALLDTSPEIYLFVLLTVGAELLFLWNLTAKQNLYVYKQDCLKEEIKILKQQLPEPESRREIDSFIFKLQINNLKQAVLNFLNDDAFLRNCEKIDSLPSPYLQDTVFLSGWAMQQLTERPGQGVLPEVVFIKKMLSKLDKENSFKLWTWRVGPGGKSSIYRFPYFQIIKAAPKGLISYGFFCDVVTGDTHGERADMYLYKHISNISRDDITSEMSLSLGVETPEMIRKSVYESKSEKVALSVSSGQSFRCVFLSEKTQGLLNQLIQEQNKQNEDERDYEHERKIQQIEDNLDSEARRFIHLVHENLESPIL